jgi:hypothetical protein
MMDEYGNFDECAIPEFYAERISKRKAKSIKCCECNLPIKQGDKYVSCKCKYEDDFVVYNQHLHCYHFARYLNLHVYKEFTSQGGCIPFGGILEELMESHDYERLDLWYSMISGMSEEFELGTGI